MHICFKIIKFYFTLRCSTGFGHHCVHHQELPTIAPTASGHRVMLCWLRPPALFCCYCCERNFMILKQMCIWLVFIKFYSNNHLKTALHPPPPTYSMKLSLEKILLLSASTFVSCFLLPRTCDVSHTHANKR
jgi:hypothetical protein